MHPQENQPVREQPTLHPADVDRVKTELESNRESQEVAGPTDVAEIKKALVSTLPTTPTASISPVQPVAPTRDALAAAKVTQLTQTALEKGILAAHQAAAKEEPYIIDALHDALAGQLYEELRRRGEL